MLTFIYNDFLTYINVYKLISLYICTSFKEGNAIERFFFKPKSFRLTKCYENFELTDPAYLWEAKGIFEQF